MFPRSATRSACVATAFATFLSGTALAQTPPPAAEPDFTFTGNVGLYSQYIFRGLSQTNEKPAVQGGFDLAHKSGLYVGTWASNISWLSDLPPPTPSSSVEWDFYGGYKLALPADFTADFGVLYYWYPGSYPEGFVKPNTTELYVGLSWKWLTAKYSYAVSDTFGFYDSKGSDYWELNASYDIVDKVNDAIGKVTIFGHLGKQKFKNNGFYDYGDWKVGVSTEVYGLTVGIFGTGTDAESLAYTNRFDKNISGSQFVGYIQKSF